MSDIRNLGKQTLLYGLSTVIPRFLNFILVPIYTRAFDPAQYGIVTYLYSFISFFIIVMTFGMETGFFRFAKKDNYKEVYNNAISFVLIIAIGFLIVLNINIETTQDILKFEKESIYLRLFSLILFFDVINALPFALLRYKELAVKFGIIKIVAVIVNVSLIIFFIYINPYFIHLPVELDVKIIFWCNLIASAFTSLLLFSEFKIISLVFNRAVINGLIKYSWPVMLSGLAGLSNDLIDRILLNFRLPKDIAMQQIGIYGAVSKLAVIVLLFNQMFRYAFEPFFFKLTSKDKEIKLAQIALIYVGVTSIVVLMVLFYIDYFKYFIGNDYWVGLDIVALVLFANIFIGLLINLSAWYKLVDLTKFAIIITITGAVINIVGNYVLIPKYGYVACAWLRLISYVIMIIVSYTLSRRYNPIPYNVVRILLTIGIAFVLYYLTKLFIDEMTFHYFYKGLVLLFYIFVIDLLNYKIFSKRIRWKLKL